MPPRKSTAAAPLGPTPEQLRRHHYERVQPDRNEGDSALQDARGALRRRDSTRLDTMALQKLISRREWIAGNRLRRDFYLSGREQRVCASYGPRLAATTAPRLEESEAQSAAHQRWQRALKAVGLRLSAPLVAIVVEDIAPSEWAAGELGYAGRSASPAGMALLRVSLASLADHYGLED